MKLLIKQFLHPPVTAKYYPQNPVLNTLNLRSSLSVRDQASHPYKTTDKFTVWYSLMFTF